MIRPSIQTEELRKRIIISPVAVGIGFVPTFNFSEEILGWLKRPLSTNLSIQRKYPFLFIVKKTNLPDLVFFAPTEAFWTHIKIAFFSGLFLGAPVVLFEVWRFVAPGLLEKEKRYALPFVIFSSLFLIVGLAFC